MFWELWPFVLLCVYFHLFGVGVGTVWNFLVIPVTDIISGIMCVFCCFQILCISCASGVYFSIFSLYFVWFFLSCLWGWCRACYILLSCLYVLSCYTIVCIVHFLLLLWVYICNGIVLFSSSYLFVSALYIIFAAMLCLCILCLRVTCILGLCDLLFLALSYIFCIYRPVWLCF